MIKYIIFILLFFTLSANANPIKEEMIIYFSKTEYKKVVDIIISISALESAHWTNKAHVTKNNFFSIKETRVATCCNNPNIYKDCKRITCMANFNSLHESFNYFLDFLRKRGYSVNRDQFLKDLVSKNYAEDERFIIKVKRMRYFNGL